MECIKFLVFMLCLCKTSFAVDADKDDCYTAAFTQGVKDCSDFENKIFLCNLNIELAPETEDSKGGMILSGEMEIVEDLDEDYEVELNVWKDIGTGKQYMYSIEGNLCESFKETNTPWRPLAEALSSDCPIPTGVYPVKDMIISLDFAESVMTPEFAGIYLVKICLRKITDMVACYEIGLEVKAKPCNDSEKR